MRPNLTTKLHVIIECVLTRNGKKKNIFIIIMHFVDSFTITRVIAKTICPRRFERLLQTSSYQFRPIHFQIKCSICRMQSETRTKQLNFPLMCQCKEYRKQRGKKRLQLIRFGHKIQRIRRRIKCST